MDPSGVPKIDAQASFLQPAVCPAFHGYARAHHWRLICASTGQNPMRIEEHSEGFLYKFSSHVEGYFPAKAKGESFGGRKRLALSEGQKATTRRKMSGYGVSSAYLIPSKKPKRR